MVRQTSAGGIVGALLLLLAATPAQAIIMRHDVEEAQYRNLGERHRGVLVQLGLPARDDGGPMLYNGMGTLIAPDWVLTAAHAAEFLQQNPPPSGTHRYVFLKGRGYAIAEVILHPEYDSATAANDIALIRLARPVRDPAPACLYERSDEVGQIVEMAGSGLAGTGVTGPLETPDGALRGATVRVRGEEGSVIVWRFNAPGDPGVTPLEGISGPGDSGGPALIETAAGYCVAGVSSSQRIEVAVGAPGDGSDQPSGEGRYGVVEVYARVSHFLPWIRAVMAAGG
ncbi:MAG: trypsin-like serine protease [Hyphomonadaceae bacterium]